MVRESPHWLGEDGVHVTAEGYQARARAIARAVRRCR
jgi:lysophospholipase L1-like esterase